MRDYLERAYGVGVVSVRSYVQLQPLTRLSKDGRMLGAWRRPKSEKRMTVELRDPFVWPEEPADLSKYVYIYGSANTATRLMENIWNKILTQLQMGERSLGLCRKNADRAAPRERYEAPCCPEAR